jgi:hypothetical protein
MPWVGMADRRHLRVVIGTAPTRRRRIFFLKKSFSISFIVPFLALICDFNRITENITEVSRKLKVGKSRKSHMLSTARHFSANYMPFAGAEIFVREHACVRAENFFWSFFYLRIGILIFPHMYSTIKIFQQFDIFTECSIIKENSALLQLAVHIY